MVIDPYKSVNKNINIEKLTNKTDKIVNEIIEFLIDEYSETLGTSGFETKSKIAVEKIIREKLSKEYNYGNYNLEELVKIILDRIFGYHILQKYIEDSDISDIRAVKWDTIYIMKNGKWCKINENFNSETEFYNFVRYCVLKNNGKITHESPIAIVSDRKNHLRIEAGISPVNIVSPSLVIRIHRPEKQVGLKELCYQKNMMNKEMYLFLSKAVKAGCNIIIAGKGGSGKTTLLRAFLEQIPPEKAITSNEETAELYSRHENIIQREIVKNRDKNNILLEDLTQHSLVMSNDVIVIGELKGAEAMSFFDGISTGHIGYATVHAESANLVLDRLVTLMKKDVLAQQYSDIYLKEILAQSVDIIVYMKDFKIYEICEVVFSYKNGISYEKLFEFVPEKEENGNISGHFEKKKNPIEKARQKMRLMKG